MDETAHPEPRDTFGGEQPTVCFEERGESVPLVFRAVDSGVMAAMDVGRWLFYLVVGFAAFSVISAGIARYGAGSPELGAHFLMLTGYILYYLAVPLLAIICVLLLSCEMWRYAWRQPGFFEEAGIGTAEVAVYSVLVFLVAWQAHASLNGRWDRLPARAAAVMDLPDPSGQREEARAQHPTTPEQVASIAAPAKPFLYRMSATAPQLRARLLAMRTHTGRARRAVENAASGMPPVGVSGLQTVTLPRPLGRALPTLELVAPPPPAFAPMPASLVDPGRSLLQLPPPRLPDLRG